MLRQTHWDATVSNSSQSPVPYHRSTGVVPFCQWLTLSQRSEGGAGRHWAAYWGGFCGDGKGTACSKASDERGALRLAWVQGGGIACSGRECLLTA